MLPRALGEAASAIGAGGDVVEALERARAALTKAGFEVDYVELVDDAFMPTVTPGAETRLLAAARIGSTRLIDNLAVRSPK